MSSISRTAYAEMYGPTTGDRVRLGDTELLIEARREALSRMLAQAEELGANAVVNVRFQLTHQVCLALLQNVCRAALVGPESRVGDEVIIITLTGTTTCLVGYPQLQLIPDVCAASIFCTVGVGALEVPGNLRVAALAQVWYLHLV